VPTCRPGDVLQTRAGITVENGNTDAEVRQQACVRCWCGERQQECWCSGDSPEAAEECCSCMHTPRLRHEACSQSMRLLRGMWHRTTDALCAFAYVCATHPNTPPLIT
jgi:hypothetical protein